jgi:hypothetical protein
MAISLPTNITGNYTYEMVKYVNTATSGLFWNLILMSVLIAALGILLNRGAGKEESFALVSFLGVIFSGLFYALQLVWSGLIFLFVIMFVVSVILLWKRGDVSY